MKVIHGKGFLANRVPFLPDMAPYFDIQHGQTETSLSNTSNILAGKDHICQYTSWFVFTFCLTWVGVCFCLFAGVGDLTWLYWLVSVAFLFLTEGVAIILNADYHNIWYILYFDIQSSNCFQNNRERHSHYKWCIRTVLLLFMYGNHTDYWLFFLLLSSVW